MKPSTTNRWVLTIILILLLIIIFLLFRCCHCGNKWTRVKAHPSEIIVWKNPESTPAQFKGWVDSLKTAINELGEITDSVYCASCDSTLLLLKGPGVQMLIQQNGSPGSGTGGVGHPGGGNGPGYYCGNLDITAPDHDSIRSISVAGDVLDSMALNGNPPFKPNSKTTNPITVAVLDTGLDSANYDMTFVGDFPQGCKGIDGQKGWNFVNDISYIFDDHPSHHGTRVTRFVLNQALKYQSLTTTAGGAINILPVKVFNNKGEGTLFHVLCGIAYAASSGAKIINASFGFYEYSSIPFNKQASEVMQKYLEYYLVKKDILMVACAGNANKEDDDLYRAAIGIPGANPRNLDSNHFYPASLVTDSIIKNYLLVVTTMSTSTDTVSPLQNFSPRIVDVGVNCDAILYSGGAALYSFQDPTAPSVPPGHDRHRNYMIPTVTGSSFATPIVTGKIAAYYTTLNGTGPVNKEKILRGMQVLYPNGSFWRPLLKPATPGDRLRKLIENGATSYKVEDKNN